jgi:hypothetical protein
MLPISDPIPSHPVNIVVTFLGLVFAIRTAFLFFVLFSRLIIVHQWVRMYNALNNFPFNNCLSQLLNILYYTQESQEFHIKGKKIYIYREDIFKS